MGNRSQAGRVSLKRKDRVSQVLTVDGITGEVYDEMPVDDFIRRAFDCAIDELEIRRFKK